MQEMQEKNKSRYLSGNGLYYLVLGNASWDSSKKKSCSKITLILISRRTSKLLRLKILYTFVRSQGICVANQAADLPCLLRISSMRFPMFILSTLNCLTHDYRMQRYEINLNISALYCRKCFLNTHLNSKASPIVAFGCWTWINEQTVGAISVMCTSDGQEPWGTFHP